MLTFWHQPDWIGRFIFNVFAFSVVIALLMDLLFSVAWPVWKKGIVFIIAVILFYFIFIYRGRCINDKAVFNVKGTWPVLNKQGIHFTASL